MQNVLQAVTVPPNLQPMIVPRIARSSMYDVWGEFAATLTWKSAIASTCYDLTMQTTSDRGPCAPITSDCSMSAVLEGPEIKVPKRDVQNSEPPSPAVARRS